MANHYLNVPGSLSFAFPSIPFFRKAIDPKTILNISDRGNPVIVLQTLQTTYNPLQDVSPNFARFDLDLETEGYRCTPSVSRNCCSVEVCVGNLN